MAKVFSSRALSNLNECSCYSGLCLCNIDAGTQPSMKNAQPRLLPNRPAQPASGPSASQGLVPILPRPSTPQSAIRSQLTSQSAAFSPNPQPPVSCKFNYVIKLLVNLEMVLMYLFRCNYRQFWRKPNGQPDYAWT